MLCAPYGTDLGDGPLLGDLPDLVDELRWAALEESYGVGPDATWGDLVDEHQTAPDGLLEARGYSTMRRWTEELLEARARGCPLAVEDERVEDWIRAICANVACSRQGAPLVGKHETWT